MTPVWFIVAGVHTVPIAWQVAQLVLVIGATVCAFVPLTGRPAFGVVAPAVSWQPDCVQFVADVTPFAA